MPVKVRCRSCQKVLNAPDRARGKAIKCPNCEEIVRVPSGDGKQPRRSKAQTQSRQSSAPDVESGIANVDLRHAEDKRVQLCPKCGAEVTEEDIDCPACGIDLATGEISIRTLRKRGLAAADPKEFYTEAWRNSGRFVLDNKHLVLQTGTSWTLLILLLSSSSALLGWILKDHHEKWPLILLFGSLSFLFLAGALGWYWRLAIEVIQITLAKKKKRLRKVNFDFFEVMALGGRVVCWPYVFMIPIAFVVSLVFVPIAIVNGSFSFDMTESGSFFGVLRSFLGEARSFLGEARNILGATIGVYCIPLLVFPIAMVHMSMPYTYKSWLPTEMIKIWAKNIGPALYWLMMFVVVNLPLIGIFVGIGLLSSHLEIFFQTTLGSWATRILEKAGESGESATERFLFQCIRLPLVIFFVILIVTPICFLAAVPAVFTMRANGLLAFYRKETLELVREKNQHEQAGFWVRYLARMIDALLVGLTPFLLKNPKAALLCWLSLGALGLSYFFSPAAFPKLYPLVIFLIGFCYFVLSEGSPDQATIGKQTLGLVVLSEKKMKQLTLKQASLRFFSGCFISWLPFGHFFGIGFLITALTPKKQALHDIIAKSVVVFRGDDDATTS